MKNKVSTRPVGMLKKHYCPRCGEKLIRSPRKRVVNPGDPDYREHNNGLIGPVEVTEYDLKCVFCDEVMEYDERCVIAIIQKKLCKHRLSEEEIARHLEEARETLAKRRRITDIVVKVVSIVIMLAILYWILKSGDFSFSTYL